MEDENYLEQLKRRAINLLEYTRDPDDKYLQAVKTINDFILDRNAPRNLNLTDPKNELFKMGESFEHLCAAMEDCNVSNPSELTIYSLYKRIEWIEKKGKKQ